MDQVFWGSTLRNEDWTFFLTDEDTGDYLMLIYVDVYGNEHVEVKARAEFSASKPKVRRTKKSPAAARVQR